VNGTGFTDGTYNRAGNVIIGYNELTPLDSGGGPT